MPTSSFTALIDRIARRSVPLLLAVLLNGCASLDYYSQLGRGQLQLLAAREPVQAVVADSTRDERLRQRLAHAQEARRFASDALALPDNRSYRLYADLHRPYVVWNVFATPELSLQPVTHCFPIAGCVAYRGYYQQGRARGTAALMQRQGLDTYIGGVEAYSTLGWFDDPILGSMLRWDDDRLDSTIFHELAHQRLYVPDDTAFNESYASFVERQGLRQWRESRGLAPHDDADERQRRQFTELILATRERLERLYQSPLGDAQKRRGKVEVFERLRADYRALRDSQWRGDRRYDGWINGSLNNARLLPFGLYDKWVPAFATLFREVDGDWPTFFQRCEALGRLGPVERQAALEALAPDRSQTKESTQ
ncbi:aminopeptidase [Pseudomonas sp. LRF_L74]|uniref:aminopeptidase n=1 Tax=Pseudomonas sp. LRF_L74 TaxID=3369422 RepID=UPI003F61A650